MLQALLDRVSPPPIDSIPTPSRWPVFGHLPMLTRHGLMPVVEAARQKHGDFFRLCVGKHSLFVALHPDAVEQILLTDKDSYGKRDTYDSIRVLVGDGILTSEGELWRRERRIAQPSFNKGSVAALAGKMTRLTERTLTRWTQRYEVGDEFDVYKELLALAMEIIGETLFSLDLSARVDESAEAFTVALEQVSGRGNQMLQLPLHWPTPGNLRLRKALRTLDAVTFEIISRRRAAGTHGDDLLAAYLNARDEQGAPLDPRLVRDEIVTFFLAGHETTAIALAWTFYLLGTHPEVWDRVIAEVDALGGRVPTAEDVQTTLVYTKAVLQESLRLYPPTWSGGRDIVAETELAGHRVHPGDRVLYLPFLMHRDPRFWDEPERFEPVRFLPGQAQGRHKLAYIPFSAGPRMCIGNHFTLLEGTLVLAMIAQRFRLSLSPQARIAQEFQITMRPRHGVLVRVEAKR
ncbi:cytochrome P450 [Nannocystis pusilla]|uniref:Cytochrome P450 n=1 Tax=Nannocystis pusilla TaxID=889268 RepID=A0ABS7U1M6_9BACT|nr:cytochrome P450 [Nannocystis pusilla]